VEKISISEASKMALQLREEISKSIFGQDDLITETLCCLLANGHILMTGAPGLAKTTLVRVFASHLGLNFGRIQYTPDLLPSDIVGSELLHVDQATGKRFFEFAKGPIFVNLLLADEINRATPRTQSAMLEAMQERRVTVAHETHVLPSPFMVFATQNPFESEGTFPLPEAQLDRFLLHTLVNYPDAESELKILRAHSESTLAGESGLRDSSYKVGLDNTLKMIEVTKKVRVDEHILGGINHLVSSTRPDSKQCLEHLKSKIWYGSGPRGGIALISTAKALAILEGSEVVRWAHVRRLAKPVLRHRIRLAAQGGDEAKQADLVVDELLDHVEKYTAKISRGLE
jgi:MoxR-like ATPase